MVSEGCYICPICGGNLKYRDSIKRIKKSKDGIIEWINVTRYICQNCHRIHRSLPDDLLPYRHYSKTIIMLVTQGRITPDTIGYEDYPCELTMIRWRSQYLQVI